MKYTIYNKITGAIDRIVTCSEEDIILQYDTTFQDYLVGEYDDDSFYITEGVPVIMPNRPSQYHIFDYSTKQWVDPRTPETQWTLVRAERDRKLQASDWTQLPDVPLVTKEAWAAYRQALRDVTLQPDPFNIVWPQPPQ